MSGTASVPNTFASAVTATGAQLDANYTTIVAYVNNPTNRNNYAADGAATNTVVLSFAPAIVGGYTAGLELTWKWGVTNTGGVVLNANGLGNVSVVNPDGTALSAGQGQVGSIGKAVSDGTRFIFLASSATPASAAQVSAAVTLVPFVAPGRMQNHPGVSKAWAAWNGTATGTIAAIGSYNVTSIVRVGTGSYSVTFTTPFTALPCVSGSAGDRVVAPNVSAATNTATANVIVFNGATGAVSDATYVSLICFGLQ